MASSETGLNEAWRNILYDVPDDIIEESIVLICTFPNSNNVTKTIVSTVWTHCQTKPIGDPSMNR